MSTRPGTDDELREQIARAFSNHEPTDPGCDGALVCSVPEHLADAALAVLAPLLAERDALVGQVEAVKALAAEWETVAVVARKDITLSRAAQRLRAALAVPTHGQESSDG